ncbi:substrate-binding periplasmic protein [Piscirickettsia litoralis]|uniref:Solute-binding protein family 3/N-terminal domain-containing protein n=1 Tax=Piscirickettsia litoralis TaxID=1891921 RepID=A0ABX3A6K1_9GAMM|nr:transporter substrate-binding domain-containing protein [Piscirickettsia litoralis]ODN43268.1 hypothetical protein BGC07_10495 [Piscirickettsia litoralis]
MLKLRSTLLILMMFTTATAFSAVEKVTLSTGEWKPFVSQTLTGNGSAAKIVTDAFAAVGIGVEYKWYPWKRAYKIALDGKSDGSFPWSKVAKREKDFAYSNPIIISKTVFYHLKSKPFTWSSYDDLKGKIVGGSLGYSYGTQFEAEVKKKLFKYQVAKTDIINLKKLLKGRIDVFPCSIEVCDGLIKQLGSEAADKLTYNKEKPLAESSYYLIVAKKLKKHKEIINKFNEGLKLIGKQ